MTNHFAKRASWAIFGGSPVKLTNLKITPKPGILATSEAVALIGGISETIAQMSEITVSLSTAIDRQGDATRKIARNIRSVAVAPAILSLLLDSRIPDQFFPQHQLFLQERVELFRGA